MLTFLRVRLQACRLANSMRRSMLANSDFWTIDADRQGRPMLMRSRFRVALVPQRLRVFDSIHLYCDEAEVWLPLWARWRLRNAARLLIVRFAQQEWDSPSMIPSGVQVARAEAAPVEEPAGAYY
jgi:hypothetical protein